MSSELETVETVATDLAIAGDQRGFTEQQRAALVSLGVEDAPDGDIDLFFHMAKRSGLDPFAKQIYMIGRKSKESVYDERARKKVERWVTKYTIQTGIGGYRVLGHRAARLRGDDLEVSEPLWCGKDGVWSDVWLGDGPPAAAKMTIRVNGQAYPAVALYSEYVQTYKFDGREVPNSMWRKMPANQLRKCAEAAAWQLAYPQDFSGLVLEDAVQVIDETGARVEVAEDGGRRRGGRGLDALRSRVLNRGTESEPSTAEPVTEQGDAEPAPADPSSVPAEDVSDGDTDTRTDDTSGATVVYATEAHIVSLAESLTDAGILTDKDRGAWLSQQIGRTLSSFGDMTADEVDAAIAALRKKRAESDAE